MVRGVCRSARPPVLDIFINLLGEQASAMAQSNQQAPDGDMIDNFHTYLGRDRDEDMDVEQRTRKALDTGINPEETSLKHVIVHNGLNMMSIRPGNVTYNTLFPCLLGAIEKADEKDGTLEDKVFVFLKEAGAQIEVEHNSPQPVGSPQDGGEEESDVGNADADTEFLFHGHKISSSQLEADLLLQLFVQHVGSEDTSEA